MFGPMVEVSTLSIICGPLSAFLFGIVAGATIFTRK